METDVESQIWFLVCSHYPGEMAQLLQNALGCFTRRPGLDDLTRCYPITLTDLGFELLGDALQRYSKKAWHVRHAGHLELRWQLRMHIKRHLQQRLVYGNIASGSIRDDYFAADLGL